MFALHTGVNLRTLRALVCAVTLAATVGFAVSPATAAAPTAPYTAIAGTMGPIDPYFRGPGSFVLDGSNGMTMEGESGSYPDSSDAVTVTAFTSDHNIYRTIGLDGTYSGRFQQGQTYQLSHGYQTGAVRLWGNWTSLSCVDANYSGTVTVLEVARTAETQAITAFAGSIKENCGDVSIGKELRWNSTVPYVGVTTSTGWIDFGWIDVNATAAEKTVTVTGHGPTPLVLGSAYLGGAVPAAFEITADACSGKTLQYGQSCELKVRGRPTAVATQEGLLLLPDNTSGGHQYVQLTVRGVHGATGTYYPVRPMRFLDTRSIWSNGTNNGSKLGPGATTRLKVVGRNDIPEQASAVVLNVTATETTSPGHLTVYPAGVTRPTASSLNFSAGQTIANSVTVAVGANGEIEMFNSAGQTHILVDIMGWYAKDNSVLNWAGYGAGGQLHTHEPVRLLDTRDPADWPWGKLDAFSYALVRFGYAKEIRQHIKAVVVNVTAVDPDGAGHLRAWNGVDTGHGSIPDTSILNYTPKSIVPNLAIVPVSPCGADCGEGWEDLPQIGIYTNGTTHVLVDVVGFYDDSTLEGGLRFQPNTPSRIVDTRIGLGVAGKVGQGQTATVTTPQNLAGATGQALALNVTGVHPSQTTHMIVWENGIPKPTVSNLNPAQGQIVPNAVITGIDAARKFNVYNNAGQTDVVIDVVGSFYIWTPPAESLMAHRGIQRLIPVPVNLAPTADAPLAFRKA